MIEDRTALSAPTVKGYRRTTVRVAVIIILLISISAVLLLDQRDKSPISTAVMKNAGFPLYYPSPLPLGYSYQKGSVKLESGILFYTLQDNGGNNITVSEQATPANPPDLSHLIGFTTLQTLAGNTVIGSSLGRPTAIILSNTTLTTITGTKNTPSDVITLTARAMSSLP